MIALQIVRYVARRHLVTMDELRGPSHVPRIVAARMEISRRLKAERSLSAAQIGRMINRSAWEVRYYLGDEYRRRRIARAMARYFERKRAAS